MIGSWLAWWLVSSLLGVGAFPIAYRLLHRLPDRGYGLSRAAGILAAGYLLWLGASVRMLRNDLGGALAAVVVLLALGAWAGSGKWGEIGRWVSKRWRSVLAWELLFLMAFGWWAFVRANNPEIAWTEKPMELAFLNSALRSSSFPPADPWLSGYGISYYYFGYVLLAFVARLTGVNGGVAFNLGNALWFALTACGTYSVLYNLLASREGKPRLGAPLLGPLFVLISGNLEGIFEVAHARHLFWQTQADGTLTSAFWAWLGLPDLASPPTTPVSWIPSRFWMWFQASRVVNDVGLAGRVTSASPISEFPYFSFLLADNHPHLLALPFVLIAISVCLNVFLAGRREDFRLSSISVSRRTINRLGLVALAGLLLYLGMRIGAAVSQGAPAGEILVLAVKSSLLAALGLGMLAGFGLLVMGAIPSFLPAQEFWLSAWVFGSLAFLNFWDLPIYVSLLLAAGLWSGRGERLGDVLRRVAGTGAGLIFAAVCFYLPWYPTFASQASGILPNLVFPTRLTSFLIMFGIMLSPILAWLAWQTWRERRQGGLRFAATVMFGAPLGLLIISWILGGLAWAVASRTPGMLQGILDSLGIVDIQTAVGDILLRRLSNSWTALVLGLTLALIALLLRHRLERPPETERKGDPMQPFVLLLCGIGALLIIGPEFLYIRDLFGVRMNTVFKFYFAAWMMWGLAAAYIAVDLWPKGRWRWPGDLRVLALVPLLLGLVYTLTATWAKTEGFRPSVARTLDGTVHLALVSPDDYAATLWMNTVLPTGVVAEAVGGSYSDEGRISAHTGLPTVIGWPWHEVQWRGDAALLGSREDDVRRLYQTRDWLEAEAILEQYGIEYVYVGDLERQAYRPLNEGKFQLFMDMIYQSGSVTIYAARPGG